MLKLEPPNLSERFMRTDLPAVSVVVPSFNQGRFIGEAIDSILSQAYPNV
jgi:cellulose synthase/poly-beta-1,6-N-acetylglucosamine synthase-like glycosyltransferase